jgi:hypothetical protein
MTVFTLGPETDLGNSPPSIILILITDQVQRARLDLASHAPVHQRFFAAVRHPDFLRRDFGEGRGQFVPVGVVGEDQREFDPALHRALADAHPPRSHCRDRIGQAA